MKYTILLVFILLCILQLKIVKPIEITAITFSYNEKKHFYSSLVNGFNEYTRDKGLDIVLDINILTPDNSTAEAVDFATHIDNLLSKKTKRYDIFFYYGSNAFRYSNNFLNLYNYLGNDVLDNFAQEILLTGDYDGILTGIPLSMDVSALYSNKDLLKKYGKSIPKTWDEVIETGEYILKKEREENPETELIGYNGYANREGTLPSFNEFLHSYRDSKNEPLPTDDETMIEALKQFKYLMKSLSSESIYQSSDGFTINKLFDGNAIFLRFWYLGKITPIYQATAIPGKIAGISGTVGVANNVGISKYVSEERIQASLEFLKYISLKELQKKYVIGNSLMSATISLYDDEEVCSIVDCDIVKDAMPLTITQFDKDAFGSEYYNQKYTDCLFDYLYGNKTAEETVKRIKSLTGIHKLNLKTDDSIIGIIIFIVVILTLTLIVGSISLLFIKKFEKRYIFLPKVLWLMTILGSIMIMTSIFTLYGSITEFKCHLNIGLMMGGYYVCIIPILYRLIINIPKINSYSIWVRNNVILFIVLMLLIEVILNLTRIGTPLYKVKKVFIYSADEKNFVKCSKLPGLASAIFYIEITWILIVVLNMLFLLFIEWNLNVSYYEVRGIVASIFITTLSMIMYFLFTGLEIKNYFAYNILYVVTLYIFSFSNYFFIYGIKIIDPLIRNNKLEDREELKKSSYSATKSYSINRSSRSFGTTNNSFMMDGSNKSKVVNNRQSIIKNSILRLHYVKTFEHYNP